MTNSGQELEQLVALLSSQEWRIFSGKIYSIKDKHGKKLKKIFYLDIPEEMSLHDMYDSIKKMAKEGVIEDVKLSSQRRSQSET